MNSSPPKTSDDEFPIEEIVFSCSICQATVSEVYATAEYNKGFHSGSGDEDGLVTKMWITQCLHVTCAKHLEDGAAPFHPKGVQPRAPCPKCLHDVGDATPKQLFSIRGLQNGQYDPIIPDDWLLCPATTLDNDAIRFQYISLCRYAVQVRKHWKQSQQSLSTAENALAKEHKQQRKVQAELQNLAARVQTVEVVEAKLKKWEERKPVIHHYLGLVGKMAKDIEQLRGLLQQFGYNAPERKYSFEPEQEVHDTNPQVDKHIQDESTSGTLVNDVLATTIDETQNLSSRKRKQDDYPVDPFHQGVDQVQKQQGSSRNLMPPPQPKFIPSRRVEPSELRASQPLMRPPSSQMRIYENGTWNRTQSPGTIDRPVQAVRRSFQPVTRTPRGLPFRPPSLVHHAPLQRTLSRPPFERNNHITIHHRAAERPNDGPVLERTLNTPGQPVSQRHDGIYSIRESIFEKQMQDNQSSPAQGRYRHPAGQRTGSENVQPVASGSSSQASVRRSANGHERSHETFRFPQRDAQTPSAFVASPFFNRSRAPPPPPTRRPPSRGGLIQASQTPIVLETTELRSPNRRQAEEYSQPRSLNGLSFIDVPHQMNNHKPIYQPPSYHPEPTSRPQQHQWAPQTPRNSQGLFQRPGDSPPQAMYTPSRQQQPQAYRDRGSLQPLRPGPTPTASHKDDALSQIRGVRSVHSRYGRDNALSRLQGRKGLHSQQGWSSYQQPGYNGLMPANGRYSVRR